MKRFHILTVLFGNLVALLVIVAPLSAQTDPPIDWIEPSGHRVVRLSTDAGSESLYFHQNAFTERGDKLLITNEKGLAAIDVTNIGAKGLPKVDQIMEGTVTKSVVGKKTRQVFYTKGTEVYATNLDNKATRLIGKLPPDLGGIGCQLAVNSDETLLSATINDLKAIHDQGKELDPRLVVKGNAQLDFRWANRQPMAIYTMNIQTGEVKVILRGTDWFNHLQFSPTDPTLIMFCHEGPWQKVDRIWTIRTDGTGLKLMHKRTMTNEIAGHEFFGSDGKTLWYDLQTPISQVFWLAGVNVETGTRIRYPIERIEWSVHFNQSHDMKLFAGDGGGPSSVARGGNGQFIYLFTPQKETGETLKVGDETVKIGKLVSEKLVDLKKHNYSLEPNVNFTPDDKWIVFRSNMYGGVSHVYAVEVKKTQ